MRSIWLCDFTELSVLCDLSVWNILIRFIFRVSAGTFIAICIEIHVCTTLDLESFFYSVSLIISNMCVFYCCCFLLCIVFIMIAKSALFMLVKWYTPTPLPSPPPLPPPSLLTLRFYWSGERLKLGKQLKYISTSRIHRDREHTRARTHKYGRGVGVRYSASQCFEFYVAVTAYSYRNYCCENSVIVYYCHMYLLPQAR